MALSNVMELDELTENQADKFETHNDDLRRVQEAVAGTLNLTLPGDADYSLSTTTGSEEWRYKRIKVSAGSPSLTAARSIIYPNKAGPHLFIFENNTTQTLTIKRSGQTGVEVKAGDMAICYHNGTDVIDAVTTNAAFARHEQMLNGIAFINMGGGDYTLSEAEAGYSVYAVFGNNAGDVLYFDESHDYPVEVVIVNLTGNYLIAQFVSDIGNGVQVGPLAGVRCVFDQINNQVIDGLPTYVSATGRRKSIAFTSDANYTLSNANRELWHSYYSASEGSPSVLSTGRDVIFPSNINIPRFIFKNGTAQTLTVKVSGQTGIAVNAGTTKDLYWDGTDIADAGAL